MQNNGMASYYEKGYAGLVEGKEHGGKDRHGSGPRIACSFTLLQPRAPAFMTGGYRGCLTAFTVSPFTVATSQPASRISLGAGLRRGGSLGA